MSVIKVKKFKGKKPELPITYLRKQIIPSLINDDLSIEEIKQIILEYSKLLTNKINNNTMKVIIERVEIDCCKDKNSYKINVNFNI